jgi:hypothetical protein
VVLWTDYSSSLWTLNGQVRRNIHYVASSHEIVIVSTKRREELILDAFATRRGKRSSGSASPFSTFVKKLQESLTRMEAFDVVTVAQGGDGKSTGFPWVWSFH